MHDEIAIEDLLQPGPLLIDRDDWWAARRTQGDPFSNAVRSAARSDRLAWVFASAYLGALQALFGIGGHRRAALCVTEDGGNTPRAIQTRFAAGRLHGTKSFVTFGDTADELLVLAVRGEKAGHKDLVIARSSADDAIVAEVLHTPFMPEVTHARMVFEGTDAEVIAEDAWPLVKGFRYVEDVYVLGATLAWLAGLSARFNRWDEASTFAALTLSAADLARRDPASPAAHIAYDGLNDVGRREISAFDWRDVPPNIHEMWRRDHSVLDIASTARRARAELARKALTEA